MKGNKPVATETECARPRAQQRSITERIVPIQSLPDILACCARGRAHSAGIATRRHSPITMKATLSLLAATTLLVTNLLADPADLVKQRAKELINQNNVRQNVAPPSQTPQSPATATPPAQPQSLIRLEADLAAIKADSIVTPQQKQKLTADIIAAAQTTKP